MDAAEVDGEAGQVFLWPCPFYGGSQFLDADRPVVMDAGLFGGLQFGIATVLDPLSGNGLVAESDGTYGAGGVAVFADTAARRVGAQQASRRLFLDMHFSGHGVPFWIFCGDKDKYYLVF